MVREFREFISKGNLVEIAVGFIMGLAFAGVVTAFTNVVLGAIAYVFGSDLSFDQIGVHRGTQLVIPIGAFITALINFLCIAAAIYFLVIVPMNLLAERMRRNKPDEAMEQSDEVVLLTEIRDALRQRG